MTALSPDQAQALQDDADAAGRWLVWFITADAAERRGKFVARAHTADPQGGVWLPGSLEADTLDGVRAMLPRGLRQRARTSVMGPDVIETWE